MGDGMTKRKRQSAVIIDSAQYSADREEATAAPNQKKQYKTGAKQQRDREKTIGDLRCELSVALRQREAEKRAALQAELDATTYDAPVMSASDLRAYRLQVTERIKSHRVSGGSDRGRSIDG